MSEDLYRKEAIEHSQRRLYGEVVLSAPPSSWAVTFILVGIAALILALLFIVHIETKEGSLSLFTWLTGH